jgi:hypothetical protein
MITTCSNCSRVLFVPIRDIGSPLSQLTCVCGQVKLTIGMGSLLEPTRIENRRAFPWLPEFPPQISPLHSESRHTNSSLI